MIARLSAASVHLLTASGAVLALLALRAVHQGDWQMMFVWLGAALIVDAADGPLARKLEVKTVLPRFSGERLDLIVDYLTYVAVPAYALTEAHASARAARLPAAAAILLSSLFHVADMRQQDGGGLFRRLPRDLEHRPALSVRARPPALCRACRRRARSSLATFVPMLAVHPFRVARLRPLTCLITLLWAAAAAAAIANPFPSPLWVQVLLVATALYFAGLGLYRSLA